MDDGRWTMDDGRWTMDGELWTIAFSHNKSRETYEVHFLVSIFCFYHFLFLPINHFFLEEMGPISSLSWKKSLAIMICLIQKLYSTMKASLHKPLTLENPFPHDWWTSSSLALIKKKITLIKWKVSK